jgi:hypothetical protein
MLFLRKNERNVACGTYGEGTPEVKRLLGRHRRGDERIILKWIFKTCDGEVWAGSIWLMICTGGGPL